MFKIGEKYKIYKNGAMELKDKSWVRAVVEHIPEHFIREMMMQAMHHLEYL